MLNNEAEQKMCNVYSDLRNVHSCIDRSLIDLAVTMYNSTLQLYIASIAFIIKGGQLSSVALVS